MESPDVPAQLETILDKLDMIDQALHTVLHEAHLSALHSTYTAAIKRMLHFNTQTLKSTRNLLSTLNRQPSRSKP